ncbi:MAG: FmdE family protein [Marinilabiliales bacterium]
MKKLQYNINPREKINKLIKDRDLKTLLMLSAQIHGHYCPGLAMGVMASGYAMNELDVITDGMEEVLAITEINSCFTDGIQYVTGCTIGNNGLIYKDLGKTAFSLVKRTGKGIRIISKNNFREVFKSYYPDLNSLYNEVVKNKNRESKLLEEYKLLATKRAFVTLEIPFNELFDVKDIHISVPDYAKVDSSCVCAECHESLMCSRTIEKNNNILCKECAKADYYMLTGNGLSIQKNK